jgi:outer membrane protein TolC
MYPKATAARCAALYISLAMTLGSTWPAHGDGHTLTLAAAIDRAIDSDPWLNGSRHMEAALDAEALASASLPDPNVTLTAANMPVDGFALDQENMTQLVLGVSQRFPRGATRSLAKRQKEALADRQPLLRADRRARLRTSVTGLWLDSFAAYESIRLITTDRALFEQLIDAAEASYTAAVGRSRQQDLIRAQLELTRLDDRLTVLSQEAETAQRRLAEYLGYEFLGSEHAGIPPKPTPVLPEIEPLRPDIANPTLSMQHQVLYEHLRLHPAVLAVERHIDSVATGVELARQKYKPAWGLSAQYGYRQDAPNGMERDDFLSVGVTFDVPLFTGNRQDRQVRAAQARADAARTDHALLIRELIARLETARAELGRLDQRRALYAERLLPQMRQQAEASLAAYNNADGDFAEAVRARIAELDTKIDALDIAVARQQAVARMNYLLVQTRLSGDHAGGNDYE